MQRSTSPPKGSHPVFRGLALVGGHPALDFLNTVKYRGAADPHDRLATFKDVAEWARIAGLISDADARNLSRSVRDKPDTAHLRDEICSFREHLRLLFHAPGPRDPAYLTAVTDVEMAISELRPIARIDPVSGALTRDIPVEAPRDLKARIVSAAAELLTQRSGLGIKTCGGDDCDWLFIDRTKANRRLWCDTRTCGNIARVRRHRSKKKAS
jgi:predicted RNA-binding Zn ribbon-like protein